MVKVPRNLLVDALVEHVLEGRQSAKSFMEAINKDVAERIGEIQKDNYAKLEKKKKEVAGASLDSFITIVEGADTPDPGTQTNLEGGKSDG